MKVKELMECLAELNPNATVKIREVTSEYNANIDAIEVIGTNGSSNQFVTLCEG